MEGAIEEAIQNPETQEITKPTETNAIESEESLKLEDNSGSLETKINTIDERTLTEDVEDHKEYDITENIENMETNELKVEEKAEFDELQTDDNLNDKLFHTMSAGFITKSHEFETLGDIKFSDKLLAGSTCDTCNLVLWHPIKMKCGHVICDTCKINGSEMENEVTFNCPIDMESSNFNEIEILESQHEEIAQRIVHCIETECDWTGPLNEAENHFMTCELKKIACQHCHDILFLNTLEDHMQNLCPNRQTKCVHCELSFPFIAMESHDEICPEKLVPCPNSCKEVEEKEKTIMIKQGQLKNHLIKECSDRMVPCPFYYFSCDKQIKFKRMPQHMIKYSIVHLNSMGSSGKTSLELLESQVRKMIAIKETIKNNEKRIIELNLERGTQLLWKLENFKDKFDAALLGDQKEILSDPFYSTSPYGYKFVIRLIFNVCNDRIPGQFISLFISICDSPFNSLLSWPFKQKIFLHLINQKSDKHITHCFTPNPIKDNFPFIQRPTTERNPFFGIEKFTRCNIFQDGSQYVVDNTAFIKVVIEPHGTV